MQSDAVLMGMARQEPRPGVVKRSDSRIELCCAASNAATSPSGRGRASGEGEGEADVGVAPQACGNAPPPGRYRVRPPPLRGRGNGAQQTSVNANIVSQPKSGFFARPAGDSVWARHPNWLHFGLGKLNAVQAIAVRWPDDNVSRLPNPGIDQYHVVVPMDD